MVVARRDLYLIVVGARYGPLTSAATVALAAILVALAGFEPGGGSRTTVFAPFVLDALPGRRFRAENLRVRANYDLAA